MRVRDASGVVFKERKYVTDAEGTIVYDNDREKEWGIRFIDGAGARSLLRDDALIIEMVVEDDTANVNSLDLPKSSLVNNALQLLVSGDDADVAFEVNGSIIHAHKLILKINAKQLHSFFSSGNSVKVEGTTPELFRFMLRYVYGDDGPDDDFDHLVENYKGIIDISDRYNIIGLKIKAEAAKIASLTIDKDNVTEILLFAHNKNCYLLKEYATQVYSANVYELVNSDALNELATTIDLLRELMIATKGQEKEYSHHELIGKMLEYNLDYDGPRDVLVSRMECHEGE